MTSSSDGKGILLVPRDASTDHETMLPLREVFDAIDSCKAHLKLVLLDAGDRGLEKPAPPDGVVLMTASSPGEGACEAPTLEHGVFSYSVIQALRGAADFDHDGLLTIPELELHVKYHTARQAESLRDARQMPQRLGEVYGLPAIVTLPWRQAEAPSAGGRVEGARGLPARNSGR